MNTKNKALPYTLYGTVYFLEGAVLTYFTAFNVNYLRTFGLSFSRIGIASGIALFPFVLKIIIGLISDKVNFFKLGYRKPYIFLGVILQSIAFLLFPLVNPHEQFGLFIMVFTAAALGMSTYDTATDGLSIDSTPLKERGTVQGIMVGGRAISAVAAALAFGLLAEKGLWHIGFYVLGSMGILIIIPALFTPDSRTKQDVVRDNRPVSEKKPARPFILFLIIGFIYPIALYSTNSMFGAYLHEFFDVPLKRVGIYTSVFGIGTMAGALTGGPLLKIIGRKTGIISAAVITAAATLALSLLPGPGAGWVILAVFGIAFGYYETIYFAMGMDFCNPKIAAFMFSVIMAVGNLGIGLGMPLSGILTDTVGFRNMFLFFALVHLLALPLTLILFRKTDAPGYRQ